MQSNADEKKITVEDYGRMETGGWLTLASGGLGLAVLLTVGLTTRVVLPTGLAAIAVGALITGAILLVGRLVLRKLDQTRVELEDHKADHTVAQIDTQDIAEIRNHIAKVLVFMARRELVDREVEELAKSVEGWLEWRAGAEERIAEHARQLAMLTDGVVDLDTVRELKQLSDRRRGGDA